MFTVSGIWDGTDTWVGWKHDGEHGTFFGPLSTQADLAVISGEEVSLSPEGPIVKADRDDSVAAYSLAFSLFDDVIEVFSTDPLPLEDDPGGVIKDVSGFSVADSKKAFVEVEHPRVGRGREGAGRFRSKLPGGSASFARQVTEAQDFAFQMHAIRHDMNLPEYKKAVKKKLRELLKGRRIQHREPRDIAQLIMEGEPFRTQYETGQSGGFFGPELKAEMEANILGVHMDTPDYDRPLYGYIEGTGDHDASAAPQYGDVIFKFKPEVREHATFTFGDSLDKNRGGDLPTVAPSPINRPQTRSVGVYDVLPARDLSDFFVSYVEAQIYKVLAIEDVEEIVVTGPPDELLEEIADDIGIPISFPDADRYHLVEIGRPPLTMPVWKLKDETEDGEKGRTFVEPYVREGVHVTGYWRDGAEEALHKLVRPEGLTDEHLRQFFSMDPEPDQFLEPGTHELSAAFNAVVDDGDTETHAIWAEALAAAGSLHKIKSLFTAPLRVIPLIRGSIEPSSDRVTQSGTYLGVSREEGGSAEDPAWASAIFTTFNKTDHPQIALLHEVAHYLDQQMLGKGEWSSRHAFDEDKAQPTYKIMEAALRSRAIHRLILMNVQPDDYEFPVLITYKDGRQEETLYKPDKDHVAYLLNPEEIFARAYSQWVATRRELPGAREYINHRSLDQKSFYPEQWEEDDFEPIAREFDQMFADF